MKRSLPPIWLKLLLVTSVFAVAGRAMSEPVATVPEKVTAVKAVAPLDVLVGSGLVFAPPAGIKRVALADEALATMKVISPREVLIHGLLPGSSSIFVWLDDGRRVRYTLRVHLDYGPLVTAIQPLDKRLRVEEASDGRSLLLQGEADDAAVAQEAQNRADRFLQSVPEKHRPIVINLVTYPSIGQPLNSDLQLAEALRAIDPRIRLRRIQVTGQAQAQADSFVLEGRVKNLPALTRAVALAERQLGGTGLGLKVADNSRVTAASSRFGTIGGGIGGQGGDILSGGSDAADRSGLANHLARRLVITSESGRVLSFLEVDRIEQILVSIRVYEIDRAKARHIGVNYRVDGEEFSVANYTASTLNRLPVVRGTAASVSGLSDGNLVGAFVDDSWGILAAMNLMLEKNVARSVAEPNVLTLTGEKATVVVGGEVPIPVTSVAQVAAFQGYGFQSYGVRLDIRPTVNEEGIVTLEVAPSIVRPDQRVSVSGVPGFHVESVETTARVKDGQSLILGGLLSYEEGFSENKIPFLGSLPLIGHLFKVEKKMRQERELVFVITPRVLKDAEDGLGGDLYLPSMESLDTGLNRERTPQMLRDDGRPSSWPAPVPPKAAKQPSKTSRSKKSEPLREEEAAVQPVETWPRSSLFVVRSGQPDEPVAPAEVSDPAEIPAPTEASAEATVPAKSKKSKSKAAPSSSASDPTTQAP
ncbi:MAG: pilus assembly protein N-terminal domain-containing protein [Verrucomicrobia bacterium]|nr:pilus assembly protein N-terminal domain-containing protein [Verrucomicrobiota bacterium]MBU1910703.1 pilus assembly protein N-terminal domain-containing protein [Verrucomicrobiota bacterium]